MCAWSAHVSARYSTFSSVVGRGAGEEKAEEEEVVLLLAGELVTGLRRVAEEEGEEEEKSGEEGLVGLDGGVVSRTRVSRSLVASFSRIVTGCCHCFGRELVGSSWEGKRWVRSFDQRFAAREPGILRVGLFFFLAWRLRARWDKV